MMRPTIICLLIIACAKDVTCKKLRQENSALEPSENPSGKRTFMIGNLGLLPVLAGVGIKFLVLLPIILSKIALLGILSFVSSNLSLLVSAVVGVRSYFFDDQPVEEDYDYDGRYKGNKPHKYSDHKDPHEDNYDPYDKYVNRYKGYESSHPEYDSYNPEYVYRDDRKHGKKRFRPFKLLGRIKDAIKDHFRNSRDHGEKYHNYYKYDPHDFSDHHNDYVREMLRNHQSESEGKFHEDQVMNHDALEAEKHQDHTTILLNGPIDDHFKIPLTTKPGESLRSNSNFTQSLTEE